MHQSTCSKRAFVSRAFSARKSTGHTKALRWHRAIAYSFAGLTLALVAIFAGYALWPHPEAGETQSLQDLSERLANANESSRSKSELISPLKPTPPKSDLLTEQSTESQTSEPSAVQHSNSNGLTNFQIHNSKNVRPETDKNNDLEDTKANELKTPTSGGTPVPGALVTNGIASLSVAIELPAQRTTDSALPSGATSADGIVELGPVPSQGLKITLDQPQVMSVQGISFDITSDATRATGSAWEVRLRSVAQQDGDKEKSSLDDLARGLDEVVARIYVEDGQLKFIWTNSKYSQLAEQLRNCVLCIANGEQTHRMQLRPFQKIAPVVLDFEPSIVSFNVEGESFPASEAVFLSVQPSPALMKSISMEPESGTAPVNKIVTLRVSGEEQSQIEILVTIKKTASGLFVAIAPRYRIGTRWQPFTTERVNAGLNGLETALVRQRAGLAEARSAVPTISSALSSAQSRLASTKDAKQQLVLQTQIRGLRTRLGMAQRMAVRKERDIPETESDIALMKKLVEVGNRLRGYTELGIRVYVTTTNGEFDLLRTE